MVANNAGGSSAPSAPASATTDIGTPAGGVPFTMDGVPDSAGYFLANPGMVIHAALRGTKLYVATWAPGAFGNDHFILLGASMLGTATTAAPWAKAGTTALPAASPFLAAESSNDYIGWFNAGGAAVESARGTAAQQAQHMEGTIDLATVFAGMPAEICLAALAYQTADGGLLAAQAPSGDGNGNVDTAELLRMPVEALRDEDADGTFDRLEPPSAGNPAGQFGCTQLTRGVGKRSDCRGMFFPAAITGWRRATRWRREVGPRWRGAR